MMIIDFNNISYIVSQVFVIFAAISLGFSYLSKDKKAIMVLCIMASIGYGGQYLFLGAFTGVAMNIVSIVRNVWFYINAKNNKKNNIWVLVGLCFLIITSGIVTYSNAISIIPIVATVLFTYSVWQDNTNVYRYMAIPMSIMWIVYNLYCNSLFGTILECIMLIFEIVGIIKNRKNKNENI